jgi:hypothetical protein
MDDLVQCDEEHWQIKENINHIQLLKKYQWDDKSKLRSFEGGLKLWLPNTSKIKGNKFKLPWECPYKMQKIFNNNMVESSTLNNSDVEKVNINKLKKCHHGETPTIIMTIVVNIRRRVKLVQKNEWKY